MARRLATFLLGAFLSVTGAKLAHVENAAVAAELDAKGEETAKEATRLYKQGRYEEAANLYAKLSVDYPDMLVFERNAGACFYYLHRPEPALSNLRSYLNHKKDITPDDKAVVDRWIDEMERMQTQSAAVSWGKPAEAAAAGGPTSVSAIPLPTARTSDGTASQRAATDLTSTAAPGEGEPARQPIYRTWWFWTGAGAVLVAGTVTAILLATHSGGGACSGTSLTCAEVK
jgi:hypothetical protein